MTTAVHGNIMTTMTQVFVTTCALCNSFLKLTASQIDAEELIELHLKKTHLVKNPRISVDPEPRPLFVPVKKEPD